MKERIVIIGGMGPQASLYFHKLIIDFFANHGAKSNSDYPEIVHISIPVPDFINSEDSSGAEKMLDEALSKVSFRVTDKVFLTCNTVHKLQDKLEKHVGVKIISLIDEVEEHFFKNKQNVKKVDLIATPTTISSDLYSSPLSSNGIMVITPDLVEQESTENIIRDIISNKDPNKYVNLLNTSVESLINNGAEYIILGCTEVSLVLRNSLNEKIIDPLRIAIEQNIMIKT